MVEFLTGKREIHSYGKESTYGTLPTINRFWGKNANWTGIKDDADLIEILQAGSDDLLVQAYEQGVKRLGGNIRFCPQEWRFLEYVFGSVNTAGSNPYTHTFSYASTLPSFTYERAKNATIDRVHRYLGCKVNSASLEWNASGGGKDKLLTTSLDVVAQDFSNGTSSTSISPPTTDAFKARHVKFTLGGSEVVEVMSGSLMFQNNLHDPLYANSSLGTKIGEPAPQVNRVAGTLRILEQDDTYINKWLTFAELTSTNKLEFIRGSNDNLVCTFTGLVFDKVPAESNLEGFNVTDITFRARSVAAVATDAISSY